MAKFFTFKYGTGVLYGTSSIIDSVSPPDGPSIGGQNFIILGSGFDPRQWDDFFIGLVLDATKWNDISVGSGSISTGSSHLIINTGSIAGSIAGVSSKNLFSDAQSEIRVLIPPIDKFPLNNVSFLDYDMWVDANNYARMSVVLNSVTKELELQFEVCVGGSVVDFIKKPIPWTVGLSTFKILRKGSTVYFIANGKVMFVSYRFINIPAIYRFYSNNRLESYEINNVIIELFYYRTYVSFDEQIVHDTIVVSDNRIRGITPPSVDSRRRSAAYAGLVDITVVGGGTYTKFDSYEYYYVDRLKIVNNEQDDMLVSIINDNQILTPEGFDKGLGGGK